MIPVSNSTYADKLRQRLQQIEMTVEHLKNERCVVEANAEWMDPAAYQRRKNLLDRVAAWYDEETAQIDRALDPVRNGRYGLCLACHEPIEADPVEIHPEAEFCFDCQEFQETEMTD